VGPLVRLYIPKWSDVLPAKTKMLHNCFSIAAMHFYLEGSKVKVKLKVKNAKIEIVLRP